MITSTLLIKIIRPSILLYTFCIFICHRKKDTHSVPFYHWHSVSFSLYLSGLNYYIWMDHILCIRVHKCYTLNIQCTPYQYFLTEPRWWNHVSAVQCSDYWALKHMWPLSVWNVSSITEEQNVFNLILIILNLNSNSHIVASDYLIIAMLN